MRKIAFISDGWKRLVTYSWVDGIMSEIRNSDEDICLYQFNANGNWSHDVKHNIGEYNLFKLPDYSEYDGIIFDCTNMTDQEQIQSIIEVLKKQDIPVVSIGYYVDGFYYVGNDNKKLFRELIDHLYLKHNCRDFVFAGGPVYSYENKMRCEAFKQAMEDYNLVVPPDGYLFGDYDFSTGVKYMEEWISADRKLPDAFVCANDNIAAGICSVAEKNGYNVPRDFLVTGFDNLDKAAFFKPQITTVEHNRGNIGMAAAGMLIDIWKGKPVDQFTYTQSECIWAESCGCPNNGRVDYRQYIKERIEYSVKKDGYEEDVMILENRITECASFYSLFEEFSHHIESLGDDGVYIVVDKVLQNPNLESEFVNSDYVRENMYVGYAHEKDKELPQFDSVDDLYKYIEETGANNAYMFSSIHFRDQIVGYTILKNPEFLYDNPSFYDVHSVFMLKLENLFKHKQLENANNEMRKIYNRDTLTGLYNRVAYVEMVVPKFEEYHARNISCAMIFFDADHFKQINDTKGHRFGDFVLTRIAEIINTCKPQDGYAYRYGGDEFVVFFPDATDEKIYGFIAEVEERFKAEEIEVSRGIVRTDPQKNMKLEEYLVMADNEMYKAKKKKKNARKFYKGMDISSLPEHIDGGGKFYTMDERQIEAFELLNQNNVNSIRLRIWNEPGNVPESKGYCDLKHTLEMAKKIKENQMHFVLDFHYSDYWADPGQQRKPKAWENLSYEELKKAVHDYTKEVLDALDDIGCLPDMVQVGNEIRSGMLFPDGAVPDYKQLAELVNEGIRACREKSENIEVMIHLDQGGRFYYLKEWFDSMFEAGMEPIDAIGISFYSFWHGTFMDLRDSMKSLIERYKLPVYVVETAHPWRQCENEHVSAALMKTAGLPAGIEEQRRSLELVMQIAAQASDNLDSGVYYWEPLCLPGETYGTWDENMGMLNEKGCALPSFEVYKDFSINKLPIGNIDEYMESLYEVDDSEAAPAGTNLIENGDFSNGLSDWWVTKDSDDVVCEAKDGEVLLESKSNFKLDIFRDVYVQKAGKYTLSVQYRGTNTTGVKVALILRAISFDGEKVYKEDIFPSDVRFVNHMIEGIDLPAGQIQVGIAIDSPPVTGRIKNFSLVEIE